LEGYSHALLRTFFAEALPALDFGCAALFGDVGVYQPAVHL
jgi:hypothetical protein